MRGTLKGALCASAMAILAPMAHADDTVTFNRVFVLGDSLSDGGSYTNSAKAGIAAATGGAAPNINYRFTTNNPNGSSRTWGEILAARLGISLAPNYQYPVKVGGTDYAEGGARVSNPVGIGYSPATGIMTTPVSTQVDRLLASSPNLGANDLVLLWAGANDVFTQLGTVSAGAETPTQGGAAMVQAGTDMATQVARLRAAGAKYVVVALLPDIGAHTPYGRLLQSGGGAALLSSYSQAFNNTLRATLPATGVAVINTDKILGGILANTTRFGFSAADPLAATSPACGINPAATGPGNYFNSSLTCVSTNPNKAVFADGVHPSADGQLILGQVAYGSLVAIAQAAQLPVASAISIRQNALAIEPRLTIGALTNGTGQVRNPGDFKVYANTEVGLYTAKGSQIQPSLDGDTERLSFGMDVMASSNALVGAAVSYTRGYTKFGGGTGDFAADFTSLAIYGTMALSHEFYLNAMALYGGLDFSKFNRNIALANTSLSTRGQTSGDYYAWRIGGGYATELFPGVKGGPYVAVIQDQASVNGFDETGDVSSLSYGSLNYRSLRITAGFSAVSEPVIDGWRPALRFSFDHDLMSKDLTVPIGPDSSSLADINVPRPFRDTWSVNIGAAKHFDNNSELTLGYGMGGSTSQIFAKTLRLSYTMSF